MKLPSPYTLVIAIFSCLLFRTVALGQEPDSSSRYAAPSKWSEYQIASQQLTVTFPKLPVIVLSNDPCSETEGAAYYAYSAGVVYEFVWHAKSREKIPDWCQIKSKFSRETFTRRIDYLKQWKGEHNESETRTAGATATVLRSTGGSVEKTRWLFWEVDRWLELGITKRKETAFDDTRFLAGLKRSSSAGVDIGSGADSILGDAELDLKSDFEGTIKEGLVILAKPRPGYTEVARRTNTQGTVMLKVTFLRNGGIGNVSVVKALPHGLTERAIAAVKKIPFLPQTVDGKPINITKQIEYTFSIY